MFNDVAKSVNRYTQFTIFDDVNASVKDGVVTLTGKVTMPYKQHDIEKRVAKIDGVRQVRDQINVLPVSQFDDRSALQDRAGDLRQLELLELRDHAQPADPHRRRARPRHADRRGRSNVDRMLARSLATQFGAMSVTNELKTDAEVREPLEKVQ